MRIYFPKYSLGAFLTAKRDARWIVAFIIICFLAGVCGSFLLGNHFGLLAIMVLGILGILLGGMAYAMHNSKEVAETSPAPIKKSAPRTTSGWDYRPRKATRRYTPIDPAAAETAEVMGPSAKNENDYVWFNALECSANTLVDPSLDLLKAKDECIPVANPDTGCTEETVDDAAVSTYDQSPIDNQTVVVE